MTSKKSEKSTAEKSTKVAKEKKANAPIALRPRLKEQDFLDRLGEKLSHFDASMILEAAMIQAGVERHEGFLKKDEARQICLALIKRGGPAFAVGAGIYREVLG